MKTELSIIKASDMQGRRFYAALLLSLENKRALYIDAAVKNVDFNTYGVVLDWGYGDPDPQYAERITALCKNRVK